MYLRTSKRTNKDGTVVEYYHLAHNERHPVTKVSTPRIVHNFGRTDELDRDELVRLCRSIARVCGLEVQDPFESGGEVIPEKVGLPKGMESIGSVELGTLLVIEELWERLGIGTALREAAKASGCKVPYERALLAMTANRLCEPESKLGVWDRWLQRVYLPSCRKLKLAHMYEAMDLFYEHSEEVEKSVFFETADLFNLEVDVIFYDTTTASFSIDEEDLDTEESGEGLRKFGHPKDGVWSPQVIVALAVTREGFPVRSWVFPGNTTDITAVEKVKADLRGWKLGRALFVADSALNSEESRGELAKACGKYLLAARMGSVKEIKEEVFAKRGRYRYSAIKENLKAKEVVVGDGVRRRRYILCYNPHEAERQRKHREQMIENLEKELSQHPDKDALAQWAIELKASRRYGRYLKITQDGKIKIDRKAIRETARYDGKWVIQTNDDTLSLDDAACGYKALLVIERCFRSLKRTRIKMTPMYHWLSRRIEAHIKICVLALLIERVAERMCNKPWYWIRESLRSLQASEYRTKKFQFFQRNELSKAVSSELKNLGIQPPQQVLGISPRT